MTRTTARISCIEKELGKQRERIANVESDTRRLVESSTRRFPAYFADGRHDKTLWFDLDVAHDDLAVARRQRDVALQEVKTEQAYKNKARETAEDLRRQLAKALQGLESQRILTEYAKVETLMVESELRDALMVKSTVETALTKTKVERVRAAFGIQANAIELAKKIYNNAIHEAQQEYRITTDIICKEGDK